MSESGVQHDTAENTHLMLLRCLRDFILLFFLLPYMSLFSFFLLHHNYLAVTVHKEACGQSCTPMFKNTHASAYAINYSAL